MSRKKELLAQSGISGVGIPLDEDGPAGFYGQKAAARKAAAGWFLGPVVRGAELFGLGVECAKEIVSTRHEPPRDERARACKQLRFDVGSELLGWYEGMVAEEIVELDEDGLESSYCAEKAGSLVISKMRECLGADVKTHYDLMLEKRMAIAGRIMLEGMADGKEMVMAMNDVAEDLDAVASTSYYDGELEMDFVRLQQSYAGNEVIFSEFGSRECETKGFEESVQEAVNEYKAGRSAYYEKVGKGLGL